MWASTNIGASSPEEVGDYFSWGETTSSKDEYLWSNYQLCDGSSTTMKRYCTDSYYGHVDGKIFLRAEDDAATQLCGSDWQMPTKEQFEELRNSEYTTFKLLEQNGVYGMKVTSKRNGNSIFLPATGYHIGKNFYNGGYGYYWMRELFVGIEDLGLCFSFDDDSNSTGDSKSRFYGLPIRPVRKQQPYYEYVDLGLPSHTQWATCNVGAESPEEYGDHFAWGETEPKEEYSWETYQFSAGEEHMVTEYCTNSSYGVVDNKTQLLSKHDAATANWGGDWVMPTFKQMDELMNSNYTTTNWTKQNGVYGLEITSKSNGNSIFLPAAGICTTGLMYGNERGAYWSSTLLKGVDATSYNLYFIRDNVDIQNINRCTGHSVRPVRVVIN